MAVGRRRDTVEVALPEESGRDGGPAETAEFAGAGAEAGAGPGPEIGLGPGLGLGLGRVGIGRGCRCLSGWWRRACLPCRAFTCGARRVAAQEDAPGQPGSPRDLAGPSGTQPNRSAPTSPSAWVRRAPHRGADLAERRGIPGGPPRHPTKTSRADPAERRGAPRGPSLRHLAEHRGMPCGPPEPTNRAAPTQPNAGACRAAPAQPCPGGCHAAPTELSGAGPAKPRGRPARPEPSQPGRRSRSCDCPWGDPVVAFVGSGWGSR